MAELAKLQIRAPRLWLAELTEQIGAGLSSDGGDIKVADEQGEPLDVADLHLKIGGEEVVWAQVLFEAAVGAGVGVLVSSVVEALKRIYKSHVESGDEAPAYIEIIEPDGTRVRVHEKDLR